MQMLKDLLLLAETKKVPLRKAAEKVYHRDYERTKNKPYRKYHAGARKKHAVKEGLDTKHAMGLSKFLTHHSDHEADRGLRHDLHLLRLITNETRPRETEVADDNGRKVVRFFYPTKDAKTQGIFDKFKLMFGEPRGRTHTDGGVQARFHDKITQIEVTLEFNPRDGYYVASYPLKSHMVPQLGEYYVQQITNIVKFLTEGKMTGNDIFFMLVETPSLGSPYGGAAGPDQNNGTADLRKDVTGMTDRILAVRSTLARHLKADNHDWTYFSNAPTVDEAAKRLEDIMHRQGYKATQDVIGKVAEQVARVYWGD